MSYSLDKMVPVLTGVNYRDWAVRMTAYLRYKNLLGYATGDIKMPVIPSPASPAELAEAVAALNLWLGKDEQVMGTIVLKCAPSVLHHIAKEKSGFGYWNALKNAYQPKVADNRKPKVEHDDSKLPTMEEAEMASKVIAKICKNRAPTVEGQRKLADQILHTLMSDKPPAPDAKHKRSNRGGKKVRESKARYEASQASKANSTAKTQKVLGTQRSIATQHQSIAGSSKLTTPTCGISLESKPTVFSMTNTGQRPGAYFPKLAESCNRADKLGIPVNTLKLSAELLEKQRENVDSTSYKDALLTIAVAPDVSPPINAHHDLLNKVLAELHIEESPQERLTADLETVVHPKRKLQRSQRKKVIHLVPLIHSEPKTGPSTIIPREMVVPSSEIKKEEMKLNKGSNDNARKTANRKRKDKKR
jgi:hypothetical protein